MGFTFVSSGVRDAVAAKPPISRVQGNQHQNGSTSSTTVAVTLTNPVGVGNMLAVSIGWNDGGSATDTISVTDDKSNTYAATVNKTRSNTNAFTFATTYILNVSNSPQTITATISPSRTFATILVDEFSGVAASSAIDGNNIRLQDPSVTTSDGITSNSITPTVNGDLIYGSTVNVKGNGTETTGTGFTTDISVPGVYRTEHQVQSIAASIAATLTASVTTDAYITAVMAFKAA